MSKNLKVGVIIPVYNARPWIEQMLHSILLQSYPNVHTYLAEDQSTDGTLEFLASHPGLYTSMVVNETKAGWHGGLNNAAKLAILDNCDAVFTASADDQLHESCIEKCVELLTTKNLDFVIPYSKQFGAADHLQVSLEDVTVQDLVIWPMLTDKALIRTNVWQAVGGYSTDVSPPGTHGVAEDWEFWIKCYKSNLFNYGIVKEPLYFVRVHPQQLSNTREIYHAQTVELMRAKHPELPWQEYSTDWPPRHRQA